MLNKVNSLKERLSDKLLIGAVTLDALLGNPSMALAQGQDAGNATNSSPNYVLGAAGIALGSMLIMIGNITKREGNSNTAEILKYAGFFVLGATTGYGLSLL
jgi:hypothetical protein